MSVKISILFEVQSSGKCDILFGGGKKKKWYCLSNALDSRESKSSRLELSSLKFSSRLNWQMERETRISIQVLGLCCECVNHRFCLQAEKVLW